MPPRFVKHVLFIGLKEPVIVQVVKIVYKYLIIIALC